MKNTNKTWTLTLTPEDEPATTRTGIPQDEMVVLLRRLMSGQPLELDATSAPAIERLAA